MSAGVSVIIPAYNAEAFIGDAIESVCRQSFGAEEILVVDDGSRDGTAGRAGSYPRVRVIRQENAGVSAARNRGIREASCPLVAFLDADDAWREDKLSKQVETWAPGRFVFSDRTATDAALKPK